MKTSITVELLTKGLQKAGKAADTIRNLGKAADKADREGRQLARTEDRLRRSNENLARSEEKAARAFHRSTEAARRQRNALLSLERERDRAAAKARRRAAYGVAGVAGKGGRRGGAAAKGGGSPILNPISGVMAGAGAGFVSGMGLAVGGGLGAVGTGAALAVRGASRDEFAADQLRVLGGYSEEQEKVILKTLEKTARERGIGVSGAQNIFGELMAGGLSHTDASAMTDGVSIFAKASQAQVDEAARTTIALRNNMKIRKEDMMAAYDAMVIGGKAGQFEVRDMAKHAPSIAAKMEALGESGVKGVRNMVALAQAIRTATGTSDEAATNMENLLDKLTSKDFVDNAEEFGINIEKVMTQANEKGLSPVLAVIEEIQKEIGSDKFKLSELVPDRQAKSALIAIMKDLGGVRAQIDAMGGSAGETMRDFEKATDNASTAFDRFGSNVATSVKEKVAPALSIATDAMNALSATMEGKPTKLKALDDWAKSFLSDLPVAHLGRWIAGVEPDEKPEKPKKPKGDARAALSGIVDRIDGHPRARRFYREYGDLRAAAPREPVKHKPPPASLAPPKPTRRPDPPARSLTLPGKPPEPAGKAAASPRVMPVPTERPGLRPTSYKSAIFLERLAEIRERNRIAMGPVRSRSTPAVPTPTPRPQPVERRVVAPPPRIDDILRQALPPAKPAAPQIIRVPVPQARPDPLPAPARKQPQEPVAKQPVTESRPIRERPKPVRPVPIQEPPPEEDPPRSKIKRRWPKKAMPLPRPMPDGPPPKPEPGAAMDRIRKRMEKMRREFEEQHGDPRKGRGGESRLKGTFDTIAKEAKASSATVKQEMGDMQSTAYTAGQKTAQQLAAGLRVGKADVGAAAAELAGEVGAHFPRSPAKKGPLRELPQMGAKIATQIAGGMQPHEPARAASAVAAKIAESIQPENEVRAARTIARRISAETPTSTRPQSQTTASGGGAKSATVNIKKIEINGVRGAEDAVDRLGLSIERRLSGTLADVG